MVMFNPEIIKKNQPYDAEEGCLSLIGTRKARRWKSIKVRWQNRDFQVRIKTFTGWTAQIIQHVITPLKIDISTGDAITPREIRYRFRLMLEDRSIEVWAYNLETVLAEKLETVITRTVTNTRMRDFYDIHILLELHEHMPLF